ncbi:MAG: hypothetical protein LBT86_09240 [Deltaproteobacteria bacterium]|jgi:hypothetical protein|nr:hypothetical protein [Deltaproteobacteria bacterium]
MPKLVMGLAIGLAIGLAVFSGQAQGQIRSAFLGGWPGVCENDTCYDDGQPLSDPPLSIHERVLEHQLVSPTCPTDLIYIVIKYPANSGGVLLDTRVSNEMTARFEQAKKWALSLVCNDFFGCEEECLPVGLEIRHYVHQSAPGFLSLFRVERINGNQRQKARLKGTVRASFHNYRLSDGSDLSLADIFVDPKKSIPLFWDKVKKSLATKGDCPIAKYTVNKRSVKTDVLKPDDLLLSQGGATVVLDTTYPCRPRAVDLAFPEMIDIGAKPELWGR